MFKKRVGVLLFFVLFFFAVSQASAMVKTPAEPAGPEVSAEVPAAMCNPCNLPCCSCGRICIELPSQGEITKSAPLICAVSQLSFILLGLVLAAFFTPQLGRISFAIERKAFSSFLWGLLGLVLVVPVGILLAASLVGIIFIPLWLILAAAALVFGCVAAAQLVGKEILCAFRIKNKPMILEVLVGMILLYLIGFVPIAGWIINAVAAVCGLGAVIMTRFGT